MTQSNFTIGQVINYSVCNSIYTGTIVKVTNNSLIVVDDESGLYLYSRGCNCGSEISFNQVK